MELSSRLLSLIQEMVVEDRIEPGPILEGDRFLASCLPGLEQVRAQRSIKWCWCLVQSRKMMLNVSSCRALTLCLN